MWRLIVNTTSILHIVSRQSGMQPIIRSGFAICCASMSILINYYREHHKKRARILMQTGGDWMTEKCCTQRCVATWLTACWPPATSPTIDLYSSHRNYNSANDIQHSIERQQQQQQHHCSRIINDFYGSTTTTTTSSIDMHQKSFGHSLQWYRYKLPAYAWYQCVLPLPRPPTWR